MSESNWVCWIQEFDDHPSPIPEREGIYLNFGGAQETLEEGRFSKPFYKTIITLGVKLYKNIIKQK